MKNKVDLSGDPKFLQENSQGVLTLNIPKPAPFDSATDSCRAIRELGEALVECKLEVKAYSKSWCPIKQVLQWGIKVFIFRPTQEQAAQLMLG